MNNTKVLWLAVVVVAIIAVGGYFDKPSVSNLGATRIPNGVFSGGRVSVGTTTPSTAGDLVVDGSATSTVMIGSSDSTKGGCIQMETVTGGTVAITVSGTTISAAAASCK